MAYNRGRRGYKKKKKPTQEGEIRRVRLPRGDEVLGIVIAMMGGTRLLVECKDGKERMCRIPGRLRKTIWVKEGNVVIVKPWELDDKKADILFKYPSNQIAWLKRNGYLKTESEEF